MAENNNTMFIGVAQIQRDWGISRSKAYQIIKDLKPYVEISESTLYPILRRLEAAELLTVRSAEHNGRLRKYYHITPQGITRIEDFKTEWQELLSIYRFVTREGTSEGGEPS